MDVLDLTHILQGCGSGSDVPSWCQLVLIRTDKFAALGCVLLFSVRSLMGFDAELVWYMGIGRHASILELDRFLTARRRAMRKVVSQVEVSVSETSLCITLMSSHKKSMAATL